MNHLPAAIFGLWVFGGPIVLALPAPPFSIEMLMSVATVGAILIGAPSETAVVVLLFTLGEFLCRARLWSSSAARGFPRRRCESVRQC